MLDSKKRTGSGTHSYRWKYHPTPWKLFIDAVTKPQETILPRFGSKRFVLAIVALAVIIGGAVLAQGPLFHSHSDSNMVMKNENGKYVFTEQNSADPFTTIWSGGINTANLNGYDSASKGSCAATQPVKYFSQSGTPTIYMNFSFNGNGNGLALNAVSQARIDLSLGSAKELSFEQNFMFVNGITTVTNATWGWYLTTNSTSPACNEPDSSYGYTPMSDPNVALAVRNSPGGAGTVQTTVFMQRQPHQTIASEDTGTCSGGSSCFLQSQQTMSGAGNTAQINDLILNFTGHTATGGNNGASLLCAGTTGVAKACTIGGFGDFIIADGMDANGQIVSTAIFPWLNLATPYYMGFWATQLGAAIGAPRMEWMQVATGLFANNWVSYFVPTPTVATPSTPDTGGFFGPIIRALISIGIFIVQNIINFLAFLANILFPVLATVFGVLANALVGALNAIGNFFGLGSIGTTIQSFFTSIGNFLVNGVSAVIGQIGNAVSFFVNGTTAFVNIAGTYWAKITSFFTALGNLLSIIGTVLNDFLVVGGFSGNLALFMDWTWGMYKTYDEGTEGFHRWLDFNENVFLRVGKVAYFLSDHLFTIILRVKQLIVQWV